MAARGPVRRGRFTGRPLPDATRRVGRTHDRRYTALLRDLVTSGRARPGLVVTHHGTLDDAPELYRQFDRHDDGVVKAVLRP